jgi:hypothetical protein
LVLKLLSFLDQTVLLHGSHGEIIASWAGSSKQSVADY